jgi:DAACS family dicarboxylate/amino acid:cation (Na+ or H+) symporter
MDVTKKIGLGIIAGLAVGLILGPNSGPLGEVGKAIIQAIKVAATPLLMFTVINAVLHAPVTAKSGRRMVFFALLNGTLALGLGLLISNVLQPGRHLANVAAVGTPPVAKALTFSGFLNNFVPQSLGQPFVENAVLPLVLMSLLLGLALRGEDLHGLDKIFAALQKATEKILTWIIAFIPLAVFAVVAKAVGEHGLAPLKGLAWYVAAGMIGMALQPLLVYTAWLKLYAGMPLSKFWREARTPVIYAAGANSSLATLPVTLKALDNLKVSKASSALGACVGTNLNNDGIILYEAMAVLFVAQAHGLDLSLGQQALAALSCLVAAMGIAGVPEAGFVSLSLVLATVGLPLELLPLLLTVDWILARMRSVVNVLSDMMVSILLDQ